MSGLVVEKVNRRLSCSDLILLAFLSRTCSKELRWWRKDGNERPAQIRKSVKHPSGFRRGLRRRFESFCHLVLPIHSVFACLSVMTRRTTKTNEEANARSISSLNSPWWQILLIIKYGLWYLLRLDEVAGLCSLCQNIFNASRGHWQMVWVRGSRINLWAI